MLVTMHIKKKKKKTQALANMEYTSYLTDFYPSICLCLILREYEEKGNKCQQIKFSFTIFH